MQLNLLLIACLPEWQSHLRPLPLPEHQSRDIVVPTSISEVATSEVATVTSEKKNTSMMLLPLRQAGHSHRQSTKLSLLSCNCIAVPQGHCLWEAKTCLACRWAIIAGVPPNRTGPNCSIDIVNLAFAVRAKITWVVQLFCASACVCIIKTFCFFSMLWKKCIKN